MFILVGYFKALLKNQTNKIYENGYFCDFIAVSNKLKIYTMTLSITFAVLSTSVIQVYKVILREWKKNKK